MKKHFSPPRRAFLQKSAAGAAALMAAHMVPGRVLGKTAAATQVTEGIDNLRVVYCKDAAMIKTGTAVNWMASDPTVSMKQQNDAANGAAIQANLDKMATALAQKETAVEAWRAILRKPPSKDWGQVKAAIKINALGCNHPRIAIAGKICDVLVTLGVAEQNITVYDGIISFDGMSGNCSATNLFGGFKGKGLPPNAVVSNGGETFSLPLSVGTGTCTTIARDADIIINIAVNKSHNFNCGGFTLTIKNHLGTVFSNWSGNRPCPVSPETLFRFFTTPMITGTPDFVQGIPSKQQLCIVDSLWASASGGDPWSAPDCSPGFLVMGTFSPAVDYLTVKKLREGMMSAQHNATYVNRLMTDFGYTQTDMTDVLTKKPEDIGGKGWVDALAWVTPVLPRQHTDAEQTAFEIRTTGPVFGRTGVHIDIRGREEIKSVSIVDPAGSLLWRAPLLPRQGNTLTVDWDARLPNGKPAAACAYECVVRGAASVASRQFIIR
jgi:plastocyanin